MVPVVPHPPVLPRPFKVAGERGQLTEEVAGVPTEERGARDKQDMAQRYSGFEH